MDFFSTEAALALQSAPFIILSIAAISLFARHPTATYIYGLLISLTTLAALLLVHIWTQAGSASLAWLSTRLGLLSLLCALSLLFLLARRLSGVRGWLPWSLAALLVLNALLLLAPAVPSPAPMLGSIAPLLLFPGLSVLLYMLLACAIPLIFWRQSQRRVGASQRQLQWIGTGAALLLAVLLLTLDHLAQVAPGDPSWAIPTLFLLSGLALCLGFAPPRWLWNAWQHAERERIGQLFTNHLLSATQPAALAEPGELDELLEDMLQEVLHVLDGQAAVIEQWNETASAFEALAEASAPASPREKPCLKSGRLSEAFHQQRPIAAPLDPEQRFRLWGRGQTGMLLAAPMLANDRALGVLGLACERAPLFPENYLALLQAFARQIALWLVSAPPAQGTPPERPALEQQEKDEMIAFIAHELRSPLTVLKGRIQLLKRQFDNAEQANHLAALNRLDPQFHRLEEMINAFVDVSYLDAGRFRLQPQPLDLAELVVKAVERERRLDSSHPILLEGGGAGEAGANGAGNEQPLWVMGDYARLLQVFQMLLGRARAATPDGAPITIRIAHPAANNEALVQIHDRGEEIPPEQHAQVFLRKARSMQEASAQRKGTGLELYISYETLRHHGGRLWLEHSELPGAGTTFALALPLLSPQALPEH